MVSFTCFCDNCFIYIPKNFLQFTHLTCLASLVEKVVEEFIIVSDNSLVFAMFCLLPYINFLSFDYQNSIDVFY